MLVPARMVNEWVYCPRLAVLEWGYGEWTGNADTATGRRAHRASETGRAPALPAPDALENEKSLKTRRLLLSAERLGLTAEIDIVETEDGAVTPVDVKAGRRPHVAEGVAEISSRAKARRRFSSAAAEYWAVRMAALLGFSPVSSLEKVPSIHTTCRGERCCRAGRMQSMLMLLPTTSRIRSAGGGYSS
ncbi:CRISPR-associated protein Cas4 [Propylenella binzhouense]|uniref:CRISPR-associated protein Cas4 n=1 Tax=Propylenella binzhouense TaxID=2555902 RepID=UPI001967CCC2|nr:hypothetical protein [Propylenella binzhouense]